MEKLTKREKVMIGVSVVSVGVAGYFGFKYLKTNQELISQLCKNDTLKTNVETLMEAASEGVFEEAIGTVNNKINHRRDRVKYLVDRLTTNPDDIQAKNSLEKYQNELTTLLNRKDKFTAAQELYAIKNED